jgi:hypothetical protein
MNDLQKTATQIFISASVAFGIVGISMIMFAGDDGEPVEWLARLLVCTGFIVLSSFGVSVGLKYLRNNK